MTNTVELRLLDVAQRIDRIDQAVAGIVATALDPVVRSVGHQLATQCVER